MLANHDKQWYVSHSFTKEFDENLFKSEMD